MRQKITKKMTIFGIGIILVSLFGLSLAGVLEYYGKVIANINVKGPKFYLDINNDILRLNQPPVTEGYLNIVDFASLPIRSGYLDLLNFSYVPKCHFRVFVNASSPLATLRLYCQYIDGGGTLRDICYTDIVVNSSSINLYETSCSANQNISNLQRIVFRFEGRKDGTTYTIYSSPTNPTYLQITKAP